MHHALAGWIPKVDPNGRGFSWNTSLGGYGPGGAPNLTPDDTGIYVPPGGSYAYQMHYTPIGKPTTDTTEVGYYFYKEQPKYILRQASITDFSIEIPAGAGRHMETAYLEFPHDAEVFGVQPHCHSRCYSTKLRIRYPDGTEKVLLNQPRYYFSWQREYHFKDLLEVPKGSLLIADYVYDNSTANLANPDPKKHVTFGEQTSEEMLFTFARFRFKGETTTERHDEWFAELQAQRHLRRAGRQYRRQADGGGVPQRSALQAGRGLPADGRRRQGRRSVEGRDGDGPADAAQNASVGPGARRAEGRRRRGCDEAERDGRQQLAREGSP